MSDPDWYARDRAFDHALTLEGAERATYLAGLDPALRAALNPLLADALADDPLLDHRDERLNLLLQGLGDSAAGSAEGAPAGP